MKWPRTKVDYFLIFYPFLMEAEEEGEKYFRGALVNLTYQKHGEEWTPIGDLFVEMREWGPSRCFSPGWILAVVNRPLLTFWMCFWLLRVLVCGGMYWTQRSRNAKSSLGKVEVEGAQLKLFRALFLLLPLVTHNLSHHSHTQLSKPWQLTMCRCPI